MWRRTGTDSSTRAYIFGNSRLTLEAAALMTHASQPATERIPDWLAEAERAMLLLQALLGRTVTWAAGATSTAGGGLAVTGTVAEAAACPRDKLLESVREPPAVGAREGGRARVEYGPAGPREDDGKITAASAGSKAATSKAPSIDAAEATLRRASDADSSAGSEGPWLGDWEGEGREQACVREAPSQE
jgi:hypothetical protein